MNQSDCRNTCQKLSRGPLVIRVTNTWKTSGGQSESWATCLEVVSGLREKMQREKEEEWVLY